MYTLPLRRIFALTLDFILIAGEITDLQTTGIVRRYVDSVRRAITRLDVFPA